MEEDQVHVVKPKGCQVTLDVNKRLGVAHMSTLVTMPPAPFMSVVESGTKSGDGVWQGSHRVIRSRQPFYTRATWCQLLERQG